MKQAFAAKDRAQAKKAEATLETIRKIFTLPASDDATLARLDREISQNLMGFLRERIVAGELAPADLERDFVATEIPNDPTWVADEVDFLLNKVVAQSVHTASPSFVGHMTSALPYFMLPLAKIMTALNQNVVKIETSKAFTPLERQVIGMLHRLVFGRDDAFYNQWVQSSVRSLGVFCSGGTLANVTALWVARNRLLGPRQDFLGVAEEGIAKSLRVHGLDGLAVLVSKRGHYSLRKAADVLGIGQRELITVPVTAAHKIDIEVLRQTVADLKRRRIGIVAIVGIAGATETGSVDPLDAMADVAESCGAHFHVDAAWGGPTLFSDRYRHLLDGIARADSVTIDAHKQLYVPVGAGMVIFKEEAALGSIEHHANYIIRSGSRDIGKHTLEGTRAGMAMLVHSALCIIGRRGFELLVDLGIGKAGQFAKMIRATEDFEVVTEPELNLLTYRYVPKAAGALLRDGPPSVRRKVNVMLSNLTESIQKEQRARGKTFVSRTRLESFAQGGEELTVFRTVLANPLTTRQILADILDEQRQYGERLVVDEGYLEAWAALGGEKG